MISSCEFDVHRDVGKVIQGLSPDINMMIKTHQIPEGVEEVVYNQLAEIQDVGVRINDDFDMLMVMRGLKSLSQDKGGLSPAGGTGSSQGVAPVAPSGVTSVNE